MRSTVFSDASGSFIVTLFAVSAEHGTGAFEALEDKVRSLGLEGIALHVFGHNRGAHALYEKLGFQATNIHMFKDLAPAKP